MENIVDAVPQIIENDEVNSLITRFNDLVVTAKKFSSINENDVELLIDSLRSLKISNEEKQQFIDFVENAMKMLIYKPKCTPLYSNDFPTLPYVF